MTGLRVRGGFTVDLSWKDGKLTEAIIHPGFMKQCILRYGDRVKTLPAGSGAAITMIADFFNEEL